MTVLMRSNTMKKSRAKKVKELSPDEISMELIRNSRIFDSNWYLENNPDLREFGVDPIFHYFFQGGIEGRNPCYLFDSKWYLERYPDVAANGMNPLVHYIKHGEQEGRSPSPYFEPNFYREQLPKDAVPEHLLAHYLHEGWQLFMPNEFFNTQHYLRQNADIAAADIPALRHYMSQGWCEDREINPLYSFTRYGKMLADRNGGATEPLRYYLLVGRMNGEPLPKHTDRLAGPSELKVELAKSQLPGPSFEAECVGGELAAAAAPVRTFAFYLPQFYPFPENDAWWGKGFTEWRNVTRALPRFEGHQQPRLPADLGFYDLRNADTITEQVRMAKKSGITGFCFYYYWFNRTRLLDKPLDLFIETCPDFPFSLMWANENWTRRWDGLENDVLMRQDYRDEDDHALVADLARYFNQPSYERIDGRPLFFIYRPGIIPNFKERLARWRSLFLDEHGLEPIILMALAFDDYDPSPYGLDGGIEFPPHKLAQNMPTVNETLAVFDSEFTGHYMKYDDLVESSLAVPPPKFDMIRTAVPGWDNEARKPGRGMGFVGSTPAKYEAWLRQLAHQAVDRPFMRKQAYVFVNAWNEWAEGAHLEPDLHHGAAYLNATFRAVTGQRKPAAPTKNILLVGHDAYLHGAQLLTLNIMKTLARKFGLSVTLLLLEGGPLVNEYKQHGDVVVLSDGTASLEQTLRQMADKFPQRQAICNTVVTGAVVEQLHKQGFSVISLIHELSQLILERGLETNAHAVAMHADHVVFASSFVQRSFEQITGSIGDRAVLRPQGIYQSVCHDPTRQSELRKELGLDSKARVIINMGYGDLRKGFDLFVGVAKEVIKRDANCHFVWLGNVHAELKHWFDIDLACAPLKGHFHVLPFSDDVNRYLNGSDLFALTSREDPFPSVVLEALACGLPVVAYEGGGGYVEAIRKEKANGAVVPMGDILGMATAIINQLETDTAAKSAARAKKARDCYQWDDYVFGLLQLHAPDLKKISVVVPNYNYAKYLNERLSSIISQTYPIYELLILDDCSPDNSLEVIKEFLALNGRIATVVTNEKNSGSVFKQWEKGARLATGDLVWIAEADDGCSPDFLRGLASRFTPDTTMGFSDSIAVDGTGKTLSESYSFYYDDLPQNPMKADFEMPGREFVSSILSIKNVVMNVSAVIFERNSLLETFSMARENICSYRVAGDWRLYATMLGQGSGNVIYSAIPANIHRRHSISVTHALNSEIHLSEISDVQSYVRSLLPISRPISTAARNYLKTITAQLTAREKR